MIPNKPRKWNVEFGFMHNDLLKVIEQDEICADTPEAATAKAELFTIKTAFERMNDKSFSDILYQTPIWGNPAGNKDAWMCYFKQPSGEGRYYTRCSEVKQHNHRKGYPCKDISCHPYDGGVLYARLSDSNRTDDNGNVYCVAECIPHDDINKHWYEYIAQMDPRQRGPYWSIVLQQEAPNIEGKVKGW